jgi:hypothetical protein
MISDDDIQRALDQCDGLRMSPNFETHTLAKAIAALNSRLEQFPGVVAERGHFRAVHARLTHDEITIRRLQAEVESLIQQVEKLENSLSTQASNRTDNENRSSLTRLPLSQQPVAYSASRCP